MKTIKKVCTCLFLDFRTPCLNWVPPHNMCKVYFFGPRVSSFQSIWQYICRNTSASAGIFPFTLLPFFFAGALPIVQSYKYRWKVFSTFKVGSLAEVFNFWTTTHSRAISAKHQLTNIHGCPLLLISISLILKSKGWKFFQLRKWSMVNLSENLSILFLPSKWLLSSI